MFILVRLDGSLLSDGNPSEGLKTEQRTEHVQTPDLPLTSDPAKYRMFPNFFSPTSLLLVRPRQLGCKADRKEKEGSKFLSRKMVALGGVRA